MTRRAALYMRISRDRVGAGLGVDRQRVDCTELADRLGWIVVAEHTDNDLSAYSGKPRPGYQALLADIRSERVDAVIAWHTDRLHRSPTELETYISVCEERGVPTHCVKAGVLDLTTPSGRLVARQLGAVARYEVEHLIERQTRAKLQAAKAGKYRGGRRAFGYLADGMTINEAEAEVIREAAARVLAGEPLRAIAADLNHRGSTGTFGGAWSGAAVRDVLVKPRTAGLVEHHGEILGDALWPAVLPRATWDAVRAVLTAPGRSHGKSAARRWLGSGLYLCGLPGCGLPVRITATRSHLQRGTRQLYNAYRCGGDAVHVSRVAEKVDALVTDTVLGRLCRPDAASLLRPRAPQIDIEALHTEANATRARLDELAVLWARKQLSTSQFSAASKELNTSLEGVEQRIAAATVPSPLDGLLGANDIAAIWAELALARQRAVVDTLVTVTILPGKRGRKPGGIYFDPDSIRIDWKITT
jgi:site-specific DNA recombinase